MPQDNDVIEDKTIPLRRYIPAALFLFFGTFLSLIFFVSISNREDESRRLQFENHAGLMADELAIRLSDYLGAMHFLGDFFYNSDEVSLHEFSQFTRGALQRFPEFKALAWCPYIRASARKAFEKQMGFNIREMVKDGVLETAGLKEDYLPVAYVEPRSVNEITLGFDNTSEHVRRKAVLQAYHSGKITATARIDLIQKPEKDHGILIMLPIYSKKASQPGQEARLNKLDGFVVGALVLDDVIGKTLSPFKNQGLWLEVCDKSADSSDILIVSFPARPTEAREQPVVMALNRHVDFASREWMIRIVPAPDSTFVQRSFYPLSILAVSMIFTLMVALHMIQKMTAGFENEWRMKHEHLINERLETEIIRREQEEARLRMTQQSLEREIKERISLEKQRDKSILELRKALAEMRNLQGILPLCSYCKKIKDDNGNWEQVDVYIHKHSQADVSHGICPECMRKHYPDEFREIYG